MHLKQDFFHLEPGQKGTIINKLMDASAPSYNFFLMYVLAIIIIALGLIVSSPAIIIGGMLVAPILYPILSLAMGIVTANFKLIRRAGYLILELIGVGIIISLIITVVVPNSNATMEILTRSYASMTYFLIAFVSGVAAAYATAKPKLSEALPGVAIAVAVLPPLSVCGIGIAFLDGQMILGAFSLFFINIIGIIFAGTIVFCLLGFYEKREQIDRKIDIEERKAEKEKEEVSEEKIEKHIKEAAKKINEVKEILTKEKNNK